MSNKASPRPFGLVLGRFQPIHLGHVEYLEAAKARCEHLIIGITNHDLTSLDVSVENMARSRSDSNPFTYFERYRMIEGACLERGWTYEDFVIVPAPITRPAALPQYFPSIAESTFYVTIYDAWGEARKAKLESLGFEVVVLWYRTMAERITSGTSVRELIRAGEGGWEHLVPKAVVDIASRLHSEGSARSSSDAKLRSEDRLIPQTD